jgi:hypothetical protein
LTVLQHKTIQQVRLFGIWQSGGITEMPTVTLKQRLLIQMVVVITTHFTVLLLVKVM